jgi:predicted nucleotidyltransferase
MTVLGIVTEYNPFHNGHLLHLQQSAKITSADCTVAVMSGNFVQRGEPAIVNKWARTAMALSSGVDLVIELPVVYAIASAEFFAWAAVKLLDSLGIVDSICFGSETGHIAPLNIIAEILVNEPDEYKKYLRQYLDSGLSFPFAREKAICKYVHNTQDIHTIRNIFNFDIDNFDADNKGIQSILGSSNNILGIEYLKALKRLNSRIVPYTIKRQANLYNEENLTGTISSATAIRKHIKEKESDIPGNNQKDYQKHGQEINPANNDNNNINININTFSHIINYTLPLDSVNIIRHEFQKGKGPVLINSFGSIILSILRKISTDDIKKFPNINEGLENRIKRAAKVSGNLEELIENICTKRYTRTRIQRILLCILLGITNNEFQYFNAQGGPQYIRILGFTKKGRELLVKVNKRASLPVIAKTANFTNSDNLPLRKMLELEATATDIYVLGYKNPDYRFAGQEFTEKIVIR